MAEYGEGGKAIPGEGTIPPTPTPRFIIEEIIKEKKLSFEEASKCLSTLGKDESGVRYAYLMLSPTERKLTDVSIILNFKHVLFLDLSGNFLNLDGLQVVTQLRFLVLLKAERNRIESGALNTIPYLQVLALNRNNISETCDITQPMLECLELNYNTIFTTQFDSDRLPNLQQLCLVGNHLIDISGRYPMSLEKLYLAMNRIHKINQSDLSTLVNLKVLHLRDNQIHKLNGFSGNNAKLTYLNLRNNHITKLRQFRKLACLKSLDTLIVTGNPVAITQQVPGEGQGVDEEAIAGEGGAFQQTSTLRIGLLVLLPTLKRINKEVVTLQERHDAIRTGDEKLAEIMLEESSDEETEFTTTTDFTTDYTTESETERQLEE